MYNRGVDYMRMNFEIILDNNLTDEEVDVLCYLCSKWERLQIRAKAFQFTYEDLAATFDISVYEIRDMFEMFEHKNLIEVRRDTITWVVDIIKEEE